jgi:hypothetical protein
MKLNEIVEDDLPIIFDIVKRRLDDGEYIVLKADNGHHLGILDKLIYQGDHKDEEIGMLYRQTGAGDGGYHSLRDISYPARYLSQATFKKNDAGVWVFTIPDC